MDERKDEKRLEWHNPGGRRVRVAQAGESEEFERLIRLVETSFDDLSSEIEGGTAGSLLEVANGPAGRQALRDELARAVAWELDSLTFSNRVSLPLVAINSDNRVLGALQALAPGQLMTALQQRRWPRAEVLSLATRAAKVAALWVEGDGRRNGIGTALLLSCCDAYFGAGYRLVFGNYRDAERAELERFYRAAGFKILDPDGHVLLGIGTGSRALEIGTDADQGMFYMTAADWRRRSGLMA